MSTPLDGTGTMPDAALDRGFFGHPRGLSTLFFTEMWERFSYYGMRAILTLYMTKAIAEPNSSLAVFGSLFPLTSPIVMMGRISFDVPAWQLTVSMLLLIGCFLFLAWLAGKIYRTGILMYGKKPSWKEMIKWAVKKP